jgi:hypothetical protein
MTDRPASETLIARQAVAQIFSDYGPQCVSDILSGKYDFSKDMIVAKATVKLTLELSDRTPTRVRPEDVQTMLATGKNGDTVAKTKDGGLTWTHVPYEEYMARVLGDKTLEISNRTAR